MHSPIKYATSSNGPSTTHSNPPSPQPIHFPPPTTLTLSQPGHLTIIFPHPPIRWNRLPIYTEKELAAILAELTAETSGAETDSDSAHKAGAEAGEWLVVGASGSREAEVELVEEVIEEGEREVGTESGEEQEWEDVDENGDEFEREVLEMGLRCAGSGN